MMKVKYGPHVAPVYGDFHTHTIYSGHAISSPEEMVKAAKALGLEYIALTDHVYEYTERHDVENQRVRPEFMTQYLSDDEIKVIGGREMNIFTDNIARTKPGLNLCAWHSWFGPERFSVEDALLSHEALARYTHIMCHPERTALHFDDDGAMKFLTGLCDIMRAYAAANGRIGYIEINTTSTYKYYPKPIADRHEVLQRYLMGILAKDFKDLKITMGSDAHCTKDITRNFSIYLSQLDAYNLLDRVVNINKDLCDELMWNDTKLDL